jgi:hypothetical protein
LPPSSDRGGPGQPEKSVGLVHTVSGFEMAIAHDRRAKTATGIALRPVVCAPAHEKTAPLLTERCGFLGYAKTG